MIKKISQKRGFVDKTPKNDEKKGEPPGKGLEARLEAALKEKEELKDLAQRIQANFENYCKRVEKENIEFKKFSAAGVVKDLLPFIDSVDSAIEAMKKAQEKEIETGKVVAGIELLKKQLIEILKKEGLEEIKAKGTKFDPHLMEALMHESIEGKKDEEVLEEMQKGYLFHGKVLRPVKVKVNLIKKNGEKN
ncbi:MAG: nucleotide exchange factor GrpE [Candidatus Diapherotrites archaeon]